MQKVKKCPKCKSEPKSFEFLGIETCFQCHNCDFDSEPAETYNEALANWNEACTDFAIELLQARIFELEADIHVMRKKLDLLSIQEVILK